MKLDKKTNEILEKIKKLEIVHMIGQFEFSVLILYSLCGLFFINKDIDSLLPLHWYLFGLFTLINIFIFTYYAFDEKYNNYNEIINNKTIIFRTVAYIVLVELSIVFYILIINNLKKAMYAVGIISIIGFLIDLALLFVDKRPKKKLFQLLSFLEPFAIIAITSYLLILIPEELYLVKKVLIPISAAVLGGLMTLAGVALTIKVNEKNKKSEEIAKAKPYFNTNFMIDYNLKDDIVSSVILRGKNDVDTILRFKNSNTSNFYLQRLFVNGRWYIITGNNLITTNQYFQIYFKYVNLNETKKSPYLYLETQDILGNNYYYVLFISTRKEISNEDLDGNMNFYNCIVFCNEIAKEIMPKELWEEGREVPFGNNEKLYEKENVEEQ